MTENNIFVARFVEDEQIRTGAWQSTYVSGSRRVDSTGHIRIALGIQGVLLALNDGYLQIQMDERKALKLAQTIITLSDHLATLHDLHQKGELAPSTLSEPEDAPPDGIPILSLPPVRRREFLWEKWGYIDNVHQTETSLTLGLHIASEPPGAPEGRLTFTGCRYAVLRPLRTEGGSYVRVTKVNGSPFLLLAAQPEEVSHFVVEVGDYDICDVIATSYRIDECRRRAGSRLRSFSELPRRGLRPR